MQINIASTGERIADIFVENSFFRDEREERQRETVKWSLIKS